MNDAERLIALDYLRSRIDGELAPLKAKVLASYESRIGTEFDYDGNPVTSFGYWLGGEKLASFYQRVRKRGRRERREMVPTCYSWHRVLESENEEFAEWLRAYVRSHIGPLAEQYVRETGDLLDGVAVNEEVTPAEPEMLEMVFKPNRRKIGQAMPQLKAMVAGLLEGGE